MGQKHYYYRIPCSSELGKQFRQFWHECTKAEKAAEIFAAKVGAESYYTSPAAFAGGVVCVSFPKGTEVNTKMWRLLGKDADGAEQWEPAVEHRENVLVLPRKGFQPSDTAFRVYSKRLSRWREVRHLHTLQEWATLAGVKLTDDKKKDAERLDDLMAEQSFCLYTELWRTDCVIAPHDNRRHMTWVARESIRIEKARMTLPMVGTERLLRLLKADLLDGLPDDGKMKFVKPITPTFFEWGGRYYVGVAYPCKHDGLEAITEGDYRVKMVALRQAEEARKHEES